jgi:hypothetical protein
VRQGLRAREDAVGRGGTCSPHTGHTHIWNHGEALRMPHGAHEYPIAILYQGVCGAGLAAQCRGAETSRYPEMKQRECARARGALYGCV